jgi:hypothetical protein
MAQLRKTGYGDQGITMDLISYIMNQYIESDQSMAVEMAGTTFLEFKRRTLAGS